VGTWNFDLRDDNRNSTFLQLEQTSDVPFDTACSNQMAF